MAFFTGGGRASSGAVKNLLDMGIRQVSPAEFLEQDFGEAVFTQIHAADYAERKDGDQPFEKSHFYAHGNEYKSKFAPFYRKADIFINGICTTKGPAFFTTEETTLDDFHIRVIGDITCDIMPDSSVPCTIRPGKIADPVYGFAGPPDGKRRPTPRLDVMAIDNLPPSCSTIMAFFGRQLLDNVLGALIQAATILLSDGKNYKKTDTSLRFTPIWKITRQDTEQTL
jgi:hypothetical protein